MSKDEEHKFADLSEVVAEIKAILEGGGLFRILSYPKNVHIFPVSGTSYVKLPKLISRDCPICRVPTLWECGSLNFSITDPYQVRTYQCRNCERSSVRFALMWGSNGETMLFQKFGENPKPEINIPKELEDALGKDDSSLYRRALISANISHGVAAVAYARRVVENKVDLLLDLIVEALQLSGTKDPHLAEVSLVKESHQVDRKIELASQLLPAHLRPGGHNPLSTLYSNLSDALHNKTDSECLTTFEDFKFVFEYLFRNLSTENSEAAIFAEKFAKKASKPQPVKLVEKTLSGE